MAQVWPPQLQVLAPELSGFIPDSGFSGESEAVLAACEAIIGNLQNFFTMVSGLVYCVAAVGLARVQVDQGTLRAVLADWVKILNNSKISAAQLTVYEDCRKS